MNIEYYEQYHQKGGTYVIPVEVFNDLLDEHQQLNQKYLNAVSDYEQEKSNVEELKKQLEEYKRLGFKHLNDKCNKLENQQKEFIEYINEKIDICDGFIDTVRSDLEEISYGGRITGKTYIANEIMKNEVAKKILEEILSKYREIIGGKE